MALTTATVVSKTSREQPGNFGRLRAKRVTITFTSGYDSTTGVTLNAKDCELSEITGIITDGPANTGADVGAAINTPATSAVLTLWNGTTKVATSDQSATTVVATILGY